MTALPIVETQAGDVSAYIPTNIISITDGQIYLDTDLFFSGQRPAIDIGLSVSRVGGDAQTQAMKKAVGALRLDLAQYQEMEIFMQFSSDLDEITRRQLQYGQGLMGLLRQDKNKPMKLHEQVITLVTALARVMEDIPDAEINEFKYGLLMYIEQQAPHIGQEINDKRTLTDSLKEEMLKLANTYLGHKKEERGFDV